MLHVLSRVAAEAACEDCGEDIWFLVPASRLPRTPGTAKTKPLRLTWHVYDGSGTRHNCLQRKERLGAEAARARGNPAADRQAGDSGGGYEPR